MDWLLELFNLRSRNSIKRNRAQGAALMLLILFAIVGLVEGLGPMVGLDEDTKSGVGGIILIAFLIWCCYEPKKAVVDRRYTTLAELTGDSADALAAQEKAVGTLCECCGASGPVKRVHFHALKSYLITHTDDETVGELCRACAGQSFWRSSGITLLAGWWGVPGIIITPLFLLSNGLQYAGALFLKPAREQPEPLLPAQLEKLAQWNRLMAGCVLEGAARKIVAAQVASVSGLSPGQVILHLARLDPVKVFDD